MPGLYSSSGSNEAILAMRPQRLLPHLLLLLLLLPAVYVHFAAALSSSISSSKQQRKELQRAALLLLQGGKLAETIYSYQASSSTPGTSNGENTRSASRSSTSTPNEGGPSGFPAPWLPQLAECKRQQRLPLWLLQLGVPGISSLLLRLFSLLHSALHFPVLLRRLKDLPVFATSSTSASSESSSTNNWRPFGLDWDVCSALLRYFLSFLPFLLLLFSSLVLLLTFRNSGSPSTTFSTVTQAAKSVSQVRSSNSDGDAAYAALLLMLPASCRSSSSSSRPVLLVFSCAALGLAAAGLAVAAAASLKSAGCEAPFVFDAFSGVQSLLLLLGGTFLVKRHQQLQQQLQVQQRQIRQHQLLLRLVSI